MHPCAASYLLAGVVILHATIGTGLRQVLDASPHIIVFISDCCCCSSARCSSTPRGLDDVLTASAVCFLALGFWLPIRHALIERHYFPSPPHFFSAVASSFSHTLATVPHRAGLPSFSLTRASSRRTSLQLLVAQAMRITVSLMGADCPQIAPRSYHETGGLSPRLPPGQALGGASYAHHRRIHVIFRTCNPIRSNLIVPI